MIVNFSLGILGVILFLFIFWKRLNEDYSSDVIFQVASIILVGMAIGLIAAHLLFPAWFFWISLLTSFIGMFIMLYRFKLRFYETFEALILAAMPFISLMFFKDSIINSSLVSFLAFVTSLVLIFLAFWLDLNYKSFRWYKSGKIGFAGLTIAIIFFTARTVIAFAGVTMISFVGQIEVVISLIATFVCIGLLISLGRIKT